MKCEEVINSLTIFVHLCLLNTTGNCADKLSAELVGELTDWSLSMILAF